jgi:hypothetical protein
LPPKEVARKRETSVLPKNGAFPHEKHVVWSWLAGLALKKKRNSKLRPLVQRRTAPARAMFPRLNFRLRLEFHLKDISRLKTKNVFVSKTIFVR